MTQSLKSALLFYLLLTLTSPLLFSQDREAAFAMNERLGRGINLGNTFEAPTETAWGNPWNPEYFAIMSELGFQHVRIPVRWETPERSLEEPPYTIDPAFLARIREVVAAALENDLLAIVNLHHHNALYADPEGQKDRFLAHWTQISEAFQEHPETLLFEVLNEPHDNLSPEMWNVFFAEALQIIRRTNPERIVLMGTAEYGGLRAVPNIELPDDENLILSVHYYNPFQFTHQGASWSGPQAQDWVGTEWHDTEAERDAVVREFEETLRLSREWNVPVHVGEFGAYSRADLDSRVRWTRFLARWFEEQDFSWAYWEFSAGFGIYNPNTGEFLTPLVNALLHDPMPEPSQ